MSVFELHNAGNTEAQQKAGLAYLLAQSSVGKAATGVISGLVVSQTTTASGSVLVAPGGGVVQASVLDGASLLVNDTTATVDVLTGNPMGSLPRNDMIVLDAATMNVHPIIGVPNATPADPTVPTTAVVLARLRNAANATTIPASAIDDLRKFTSLAGAPVPVRNTTERDALAKTAGLAVYRLDTNHVEVWDGSAWVVQRTAGDMQTDVASLTGDATNQRFLDVTFAKPFAAAPIVTLQILTGMTSSSTTQSVWPSSVTTTGFRLNGVRNNTTTMAVQWIAQAV